MRGMKKGKNNDRQQKEGVEETPRRSGELTQLVFSDFTPCADPASVAAAVQLAPYRSRSNR